MTATRFPARIPDTSFPVCPLTVETGQSGIFSLDITTGDSTKSATEPEPDPRMIAISGRIRIRLRRNSAARFMSANVMDGFNWMDLLLRVATSGLYNTRKPSFLLDLPKKSTRITRKIRQISWKNQ